MAAFMRKLARGHSEATPARALSAVAMVVYTGVGVVLLVALLLYLLL